MESCLCISLVVICMMITLPAVRAACLFPSYYDGSWYHRESGSDTNLIISSSRGTWDTNRECYQLYMHPKTIAGGEGQNATLLLKRINANCYICMDVIYRSIYIMQYRRSECITRPDINLCPGMTRLPEHNEVVTMFKQVSPSMDCIASFEGLYQFTYEINEKGGGICNNSESILEACQTPGSPNYDNKDFTMKYRDCPDIQSSFRQTIRYKCMGTWVATMNNSTYTFVGLVHDETGVVQDKYKCLMTLRDQHSEDNTIRWGLSRFGDCRNLKSLEQSPIRIVLRRVAPKTSFMTPKCTLPRNITGNWFTQGIQFASDVWINDTHIHYKTMISQFEYEETWFSCQANLGTRYLMAKVVVGRCEISFVCFDLVPRHDGIVRYRVGRSTKLPFLLDERARDKEFLSDSFRETCSWQWLTFSRENVNWKYEVLVQNPPSPVICPIGGRYSFRQFSNDFFQLYDTRIRGMTLSPRNQINCLLNVSEFKSCDGDLSKLEIDASYCETVDYRGRPIGEYDEPDHILTCAGYWLEDMKSYLITYDEEDAISKFRCWVYERISWTDIAMSRSETARCPKNQNSRSYEIDGARLYLQLTETERLFDDCPPRFDSGIVTNAKPRSLYVLNSGSDYLNARGLWFIALLAVLCLYDIIFTKQHFLNNEI
ncbi:uncharacterized protein LOC106065122 isoform X1 [Biomphalaria glabrata]|uniref:Uncharacterized protein LOC106065122 isoform X1 n=2 Tax=Biomphalaria glabrata TaxID=6526 RepID=A0A9W3AAY6_BIOGL|nr:uncharacterized protein LOC106065122 isoform X1 [Biomphalaria glabrata]KAI8773700.1 CAunnamed protein product [Biomphalaria glabrata]